MVREMRGRAKLALLLRTLICERKKSRGWPRRVERRGFDQASLGSSSG